jgi:hypothetical protein
MIGFKRSKVAPRMRPNLGVVSARGCDGALARTQSETPHRPRPSSRRLALGQSIAKCLRLGSLSAADEDPLLAAARECAPERVDVRPRLPHGGDPATSSAASFCRSSPERKAT